MHDKLQIKTFNFPVFHFVFNLKKKKQFDVIPDTLTSISYYCWMTEVRVCCALHRGRHGVIRKCRMLWKLECQWNRRGESHLKKDSPINISHRSMKCAKRVFNFNLQIIRLLYFVHDSSIHQKWNEITLYAPHKYRQI